MNRLFSPDLPCTVHVEKGAVLASHGERGGTLFLLLSGTAVKTLPDSRPVPLQRGELFGGEALLLDHPYTATLVAVTEVTALALTRDSLGELFSAAPEAAFELLRLLYLSHPPADAKPPRPPALPKEQKEPKEPKEPAEAPSEPVSESKQQPAAPIPMQDDLFLEGHGIYDLGLDNDSPLLYQKSQTCPMCKHTFKATAVRASKLVTERTDDDMRVHYVGIEPLHYEVVTCPKCWYSALIEQFEEADRRPTETFFDEMRRFQDSLPLRFDLPPDSVTVFASYYLALRSAPLCFYRHEAILSRLWVKLSRLYEDCGDTAMWRASCEHALETYLYLYEKTEVHPARLQQICYMLGELNYRLGHLREARRFFFEAKTDPMGSPAVKRMADRRISFIQEEQREEQPEAERVP